MLSLPGRSTTLWTFPRFVFMQPSRKDNYTSARLGSFFTTQLMPRVTMQTMLWRGFVLYFECSTRKKLIVDKATVEKASHSSRNSPPQKGRDASHYEYDVLCLSALLADDAGKQPNRSTCAQCDLAKCCLGTPHPAKASHQNRVPPHTTNLAVKYPQTSTKKSQQDITGRPTSSTQVG